LSYTLLSSLGTDGNIVGFRTYKSSIIFNISPLKNPTEAPTDKLEYIPSLSKT
jgi:hypothetical protein